VRKFAIVRKFIVTIAMLVRLVATVVEVNVLQVHRSCTATPNQQCSVPVVAPSFKRLVLLRNARLVAIHAPATAAATATAAAIATAAAATTAAATAVTTAAADATAAATAVLPYRAVFWRLYAFN
jgi:hypothetical protein